MTHLFSVRLLLVLTVVVVTAGCGGNGTSNPSAADTTYGAPVDATDAIPAAAIAAEPDRYLGRHVTVDGRMMTVQNTGCTLHVDTETGIPLRIDAARSQDRCGWQVPSQTAGFAIAEGMLRREDDTLRLTAEGVQITPIRRKNGAE